MVKRQIADLVIIIIIIMMMIIIIIIIIIHLSSAVSHWPNSAKQMFKNYTE